MLKSRLDPPGVSELLGYSDHFSYPSDLVVVPSCHPIDERDPEYGPGASSVLTGRSENRIAFLQFLSGDLQGTKPRIAKGTPHQ